MTNKSKIKGDESEWLLNRVKELEESLTDMVDQFAYELDCPPRIHTGGLGALEQAFDLLGYTDPQSVPERKCQYEDCQKTTTCGTPTPDGYRRVCLEHFNLINGYKKEAIKNAE